MIALGHIVGAACDVCGIPASEFFAKLPGHGNVMAARARMLAVVAAVESGHRPSDVGLWLKFSSPMTAQLRSRYADRVKLGDERLARAVETVKDRAAAAESAGKPGVALPGKKSHLPPITFTRTKPPRPPHGKPGPKAKPERPKERVLGPADLLPEHEVIEAKRLRKEGWSFKGLTRRFELDEERMRIVVVEPL